MEKVLTAYIDCRFDRDDTNDFYTLNMWGKPCFEYVCDAVAETDVFAKKYLLTDSEKIKTLASKYELEVLDRLPTDKSPKMVISGKAIFLTKKTLTEAASTFMGGVFCQLAEGLRQARTCRNNLSGKVSR